MAANFLPVLAQSDRGRQHGDRVVPWSRNSVIMLVTSQPTRNASGHLITDIAPMLYLVRRLLTLAESKFIQKSEKQLSMLQHVLGVNVLDGVIGCVDVRIAVVKRSLEDERSRVSVPCSRAVVRARVAADTVDALNVGILQACQPISCSKVCADKRTSSITRSMYSFSSGSVKSVIRPKLSGLLASSVAFV